MARRTAAWLTALAYGCFGPIAAAATADDVPELTPTPEATKRTSAPRLANLKVFGELAIGRMNQRYGLGSDDARRASLDVTWSSALAPGWRMVVSDRLDDMHPVESGGRATTNSLREAYVGWHDDSGRWSIDLGRVNYRNGPAYGYNPTDFLRDGSSRILTSVDPLALRENRLGTAMVKAQRLGDTNSITLVLAPKLASQPSTKSWDADLGATNSQDRLLVVWGAQLSRSASYQLLTFYEKDKGAQIGANMTALLGDSFVAFAEGTHGRDFDLEAPQLTGKSGFRRAGRAAIGATFTTAQRTAFTLEYEYNGFAVSKSLWNSIVASAGVEALLPYQVNAQDRQEIASRHAALLYVSQRDFIAKNLDVTGLIRFNLDDRSRFAWIEARYHWPRVDVALQWRTNSGRDNSEYGAQTTRRLVQILVAAYY